MSYVDLEGLWDSSQVASRHKHVEKYIEIAPWVDGGHGRGLEGRGEY